MKFDGFFTIFPSTVILLFTSGIPVLIYCAINAAVEELITIQPLARGSVPSFTTLPVVLKISVFSAPCG